MNNTSIARRTVSSLRTTLVLVAFAALAAVGFAAARSASSVAKAQTAGHTATGSSKPLTTPCSNHTIAPAGCPMSACVFGR